MNDSLGDRMKSYEAVSDISLPIRMPTIIRVDGVAFHTFTKGLIKPWDGRFISAMLRTAMELCKRVQGAKIAYVQSDEITVLVTDYDDIHTQPWLKKRVQKMASHAAAIAAKAFFIPFVDTESEIFDARVFVVPKEDVCNNFIWRQQDATRNSIQALGHYHFSHKSMSGLSNDEVQERLFTEADVNWNDLPVYLKRGAVIRRRSSSDPAYSQEEQELLDKTIVCSVNLGVKPNNSFMLDLEPPVFTQDREYIERYVNRPQAQTNSSQT